MTQDKKTNINDTPLTASPGDSTIRLSENSLISEILVVPTEDPYAGKEVYLEVEDGREVFYHGNYVLQIPLHNGELLIGRRDVMAGHYPDVDLAMYWRNDRSLSRKHLRIYSDINGAYYVEDICNNNATFINDRNHPLNRDRAELKPGDRIIVSNSVSFVFRVRG